MFTFLQLAFAGVWTYVWQWGVSVTLIILLVGAAYFTTAIPVIGPYLRDMRAHLLWAAFGIAIFLFGHTVGHRAAMKRVEIKEVIIERTVEKAVKNTTTPKAKRQPDRWDRPEH